MTTINTFVENTREAFGADKAMHDRIIHMTLQRNFRGQVTYRQGFYIEGTGACKNMGYGEIKMRVKRILATGEPIELQLDCLTFRGAPVYLEGRVANCYKDAESGDFIALVRVEVPVVKAEAV